MDAVATCVQFLYWLALSTWFGGVLFIAVAAPIIFRTIRENDPTLPTVLSVNLEGQHATLLAGSIVADLLTTLLRIQLACAGTLALMLLAQCAFLHGQTILTLIRAALYLAAVVLLIYDWRIVSPRIFKYRQEYIDHADEPDTANAAKDQFDRYHRERITLLMLSLCALLGLVSFSAVISTAPSTSFLLR